MVSARMRKRPHSLQDVLAAVTVLAVACAGGTQYELFGGMASRLGHALAFAALFAVPSGVVTAAVCLAKGWREGLFAGLVCWIGLLLGVLALAFAFWYLLPVD